MKRRVYHLAKEAELEPEFALAILQAAGFNTHSVNDQIAISLVKNALAILTRRPDTIHPAKLKLPDSTHTSNTQYAFTKGQGTYKPQNDTHKQSLISAPITKYRHKGRNLVHYLGVDDLLAIHNALVDMFAAEDDPISPPGPKDMGLLESAAHRPRTSLGDTEKYPNLYAKAAALFHSMVKNHPFHNGNKRTALVSLVVFLDRNDQLLETSDDDLFNFVIDTAKENPRENGGRDADAVIKSIETWIQDHSTRADDQFREMRLTDFLNAVEKAGGRYREGSHGDWIVWGPNNDSVSISKSTSKLNGSVVKKYTQKIGLSYGQTGIHFDEFKEGLDPEQRLIRRFRVVLKKLANV